MEQKNREYKVYLIRHGMTKGNLEKRYVGTTDEPILPQSVEELMTMKKLFGASCEMPQHIIVSPMKRCIQTAEILFPQISIKESVGLGECDFGQFEYMNYKELAGNKEYQKYIDTMGECGFPGGETKAEFQKRCICTFEKEIRNMQCASTIAFVVHGGTIMAILDQFSNPHKDYFEWQVENGCGYQMDLKISAGQIQCDNIKLLMG